MRRALGLQPIGAKAQKNQKNNETSKVSIAFQLFPPLSLAVEKVLSHGKASARPWLEGCDMASHADPVKTLSRWALSARMRVGLSRMDEHDKRRGGP